MGGTVGARGPAGPLGRIDMVVRVVGRVGVMVCLCAAATAAADDGGGADSEGGDGEGFGDDADGFEGVDVFAFQAILVHHFELGVPQMRAVQEITGVEADAGPGEDFSAVDVVAGVEIVEVDGGEAEDYFGVGAGGEGLGHEGVYVEVLGEVVLLVGGKSAQLGDLLGELASLERSIERSIERAAVYVDVQVFGGGDEPGPERWVLPHRPEGLPLRD